MSAGIIKFGDVLATQVSFNDNESSTESGKASTLHGTTEGNSTTMIQHLMKKREQEEGFTLVELLVVIVILGILAAIVVFAVGGITDKGTTAANNTDVSVLQAAEEAAFANVAAGAYLSESALVSGKYLRTLSTKNDICLKGTTDYAVVAAPASAASCTAALAGSVPAP